MPYSNPLLRRVFLIAMVAYISACGSLQKKDSADAEAEQAATEGVEGAAFVAIPNPYQPGNVPGAAQKEHAKIKQLMVAKKWDQAKGALELMVQTFPKLSGPYINLGIVHKQLGENEEAEKALKYAMEVNPQNLDAHVQLGLLYRELGRFEDAEQVYLEALNVWPHHLSAVTNLGILYDLYMGRFADALTYYELAQQLQGGEDRQLKGWIVDIKRRMDAQ